MAGGALSALRLAAARARTPSLGGKPLRPTRELIGTPEWNNWFGGSRVVDADGKPLVVYHGTDADITEFDLAKSRFKRVDLAGRSGISDVYANRDGGNVMPLYIRITNPATQAQYLAARGKVGTRNAASYLTEQGYDGVADGAYYQVFSPTQIKSALSNTGEFSLTNPDTRGSATPAAMGAAGAGGGLAAYILNYLQNKGAD